MLSTAEPCRSNTQVRDESKPMTKLALATVALAMGTAAIAQPLSEPSEGVPLLKTLPADAFTVADYYKQKVYDPADEKIGQIVDLILDKSGAVPAAMISVGSFLGIKTKYVAVPFAALQVMYKEHKPYLVLDTSRRRLKNAPSFEFNRSTRRWERLEE
jgi:PRC-barrel domain